MINGGALISGYFDGTLSDAEVAELQAWIVADPANAKLFAKHAIVHQQMGVVLGSERTLRIASTEKEQSRTAAGGAPGAASAEFHGASRWLSQRMKPAGASWAARGRGLVYGGLAAAAAIVVICGVVTWKQFAAPAPLDSGEEEVVLNRSPAFITGDVGAEWKDSADEQRSDLAAGKQLQVVAGYVELTFASGAQVVVQGPSTFTIDSSQAMTLQSGRLAATVEGGGFVVNTPGAKVTDLGTEFGVVARDHGTTAVEVFKGRVTVQGSETAAAATTRPAVYTLSAGDGATMQGGIFKQAERGSAGEFVRHLSTLVTSLDVVDLMCGGDGTTHRRGVGIDVATGIAGKLQVERESSDGHYHRVATLPAVDGCFIPSRTVGATQVDSAGDTFTFPVTSNLTQGLLWAGGRPLDPYGRGLTNTVLGGTDFSESGHGALFMYSNKGVTLDLTKIPRPPGKGSLYEFRCTVGNAYTKMLRPQRSYPKADVYVLVDGVVRFKRLGFSAKPGPFPVKVSLKEGDHFLTLVTTDGGDTRKDDYVLWGDPALEIMRPSASKF